MILLLLSLLLPVLACAQTQGPIVRKDCLADVRDTTSQVEGIIVGQRGCDRIMLRDGGECRFGGTPGTATGWVCSATAGRCGDAVLDAAEQCDAPGGIAPAELANYLVAHYGYASPLVRRSVGAGLITAQEEPPRADAAGEVPQAAR